MGGGQPWTGLEAAQEHQGPCVSCREEPNPTPPHLDDARRETGLPSEVPQAAQTAGWLWPSGHTEGDWLRAPPPLMNLVEQKKGELGTYQEKFHSRLLEAAVSLASTGHCCNENCTSNCQN